jgi:Bacterial regulatory proteins, lacI family
VELSDSDPRPGRVTIREVAELVGVSIATVSRVANGRSGVSVETRDAAHRVSTEHGYPANARSRPESAGLIRIMVRKCIPPSLARPLAWRWRHCWSTPRASGQGWGIAVMPSVADIVAMLAITVTVATVAALLAVRRSARAPEPLASPRRPLATGHSVT